MPNAFYITFLRHGRSRADDEQVHEGRYDSPLTETGQQQALKRAKHFETQGIQFDRIISSPLMRSQKTAKIISDYLKLPLVTDPDWMERDNGPLQGIPFSVSQKQYPLPDFINPFQPYVFSTGDGEGEWALYCRAVKALGKIISRGPGAYLVVAHGGILNAALRSIVGSIPSANHQGVAFHIGDTGYVRTVYLSDKHRWIIKEFCPE